MILLPLIIPWVWFHILAASTLVPFSVVSQANTPRDSRGRVPQCSLESGPRPSY